MQRFCTKLENNEFRGNSIDFLYFMLVGFWIQIFAAAFLKIPFLSDSLMDMVLYVWSRTNQNGIVVIFGFLPMPAPYLNWYFCDLGFILDFNVY